VIFFRSPTGFWMRIIRKSGRCPGICPKEPLAWLKWKDGTSWGFDLKKRMDADPKRDHSCAAKAQQEVFGFQ
jgi:hypothetical protein